MLVFTDERGIFDETTHGLLGNVTMVLGGLLLVLACLFMFLIDENYRGTFFSMETSEEMVQTLFLVGEDDEKQQVMSVNKYWRESIDDKVEAWVKSG